MLLLDFDRAFQRYVTEWVKQNQARFKGNMDRMEMEMPQLYLDWIQAPADFLDGKSPLAYFAGFTDADQLVSWMADYLKKSVPVPDLLLERIVELGQGAEAPLMALLRDPDAPLEAQLHAMDLLRQLESAAPVALYLDWVAQAATPPGDRAELAADALLSLGTEALPGLMAALEGATQAGQDILLDILCHHPGDERVVDLALARFSQCEDNRALYAGYLGKLGDPRALPALQQAAADPATNYLDFIEIRSAIEELGGESPAERAFENDPYYDALGRVDP